MEIKPVELNVAPGLEEADLCSRSGLNEPPTFTTIYTRDFPGMMRFYRQLFGADAIRFEADEIAAFRLKGGFELLLQEVPGDSVFARLVGTQSVGLAVNGEEWDALLSAAGTARSALID